MANTWRYTTHGFKDALHDEEMSVSETANAISGVVKASTWYRSLKEYNEHDTTLDDLLEELRDAGEDEDVEWFDTVLAAIYDEADYHRVWLG